MRQTIDLYPIPNEAVISREVDGDAVLVLPEEGQVKVLNEVGARIWSLADGTLTVRELAILIFHEYQIDLNQAETDVIEFVEILQELDVISLSENPAA